MIKLHSNKGEMLVNPTTISRMYQTDTGVKIFFDNGDHVIVNETLNQVWQSIGRWEDDRRAQHG